MEVLRKSCNNFIGIQKKLSEAICNKDFERHAELIQLIQMLEILVPSYSLDLLATIIIAVGKPQDCVCKKVKELDIFKMLN